jgi:hypothetical protein
MRWAERKVLRHETGGHPFHAPVNRHPAELSHANKEPVSQLLMILVTHNTGCLFTPPWTQFCYARPVPCLEFEG